uniref:Secreted protein n=1 Tax=Strongyloides papillosus TaxID=174720 RepID=A0A0N5BQZ2_STREA
MILVVDFDVVVAVAGVVVVVEFVEAIVGFVVADDSLVVEFDVIFEIVKRIFRDYVGCVQLLFDQMKYS